jgi:hypothetical protein
MLFMVIERFKNQDPIPVYRRVRDLNRAEFRALLPAHGMRRSAADAGVGAHQQP